MDDVTLLLANASEQTPGGTLSALGIGWSMTTSPTPPSALLMFVKVPWDRTNVRHSVVLDLITDDGQPASVEGGPLQITLEFETGRPAGLAHGTPIDWIQGLNLGPLPLPPGRFEWRMTIDRCLRVARLHRSGLRAAARACQCANVTAATLALRSGTLHTREAETAPDWLVAQSEAVPVW